MLMGKESQYEDTYDEGICRSFSFISGHKVTAAVHLCNNGKAELAWVC